MSATTAVAGCEPLPHARAARRWRAAGWGDVRAGALAMAPLLIGYAPFALTVGAAGAAEGPWLPRWLATFLIYGGSANLAVLQTLDAGAGLAVVVLTGLVTQARLLAYSSSLAPHWRDQGLRFRMTAAAFVIEPSWALTSPRYAASSGSLDERAAAHRYYAGAVAVLTVGWGAMVTAGMVTGTSEAATELLALAVPLSLMTMVVPAVTDRPTLLTALVAATVALVTTDLPAGTGILLAMAAGIAAGAVAHEATPDAGERTGGAR